jgi:hypothetical protein
MAQGKKPLKTRATSKVPKLLAKEQPSADANPKKVVKR